MTENPLKYIMNPASIATVGAGNNPLKMGTLHALSILKDGYRGKFLPVHPREKTVLGHSAYRSIEDLPEVPDLGLIIVPAPEVPGIVESFAVKGTRGCIIVSAGFRETGDEGTSFEKQLLGVSSRYGIKFIGPNCMGIINGSISLNTTVMRYAMGPGGLGFASQSGTYITQNLPYLHRRGIRFSKAISVGNSTTIDITDALEYLGNDPETKSIALYVEGISDTGRFLDVARRITALKPVVAQFVGGSEAGARSGMSHTGALGAPDFLYDGLFRQAGIIRLHSIEELLDHGWVLATQPRLKGKRIGVLTNSGGPGSSMANTCNQGGLEIPEFSEALKRNIASIIPPHAACSNPVDITFNMDIGLLTKTIPEMVMDSGEADGIVLHGAMKSGFIVSVYPHIRELLGGMSMEEINSQFVFDMAGSAALPWKYEIPLVISSFMDSDDDCIAFYREQNVPVFDSPEKAARAMLSLHGYLNVTRRHDSGHPEMPERVPGAVDLISDAVAKGMGNLDEYQSKRLLALYGIPVTREQCIYGMDDIDSVLQTVGFPAAVKACSHEIAHKTGKGLIRLNINSIETAREAVRDIRRAAGSDVALLVSEMVKGERELSAGILRHQGFGPAVMFGIGGIFTEALRDMVFRRAPLRESEAREMLFDIRSQGLLREFRGMPGVDIDTLAVMIQTLSFLPLLHPEILEIDINPIIIAGTKPVAADALVVLSSGVPG
ncbi:MAG TPA: acetate--CoA ligase family protein [Spirochaetota bacterium]|nr:acetate--CoA ligase family protein [Spirochaetota bacterium]